MHKARVYLAMRRIFFVPDFLFEPILTKFCGKHLNRQALAGAGAQVVLASRRTDRLKELRAEIEADGGAAHVVSLDVTDMASIKSAIAHAETEAGPIDILVNNSGVSTTQRLVDVTEDDYNYVMDTNLRGAFFVIRETDT